jgi:hypothetical protein
VEKPENSGFSIRKASLLRIYTGFSDRWINATMVVEDKETYKILGS